MRRRPQHPTGNADTLRAILFDVTALDLVRVLKNMHETAPGKLAEGRA